MTNLNIVDSEQQLRKRRSKSFKTTLIHLTKLVYMGKRNITGVELGA